MSQRQQRATQRKRTFTEKGRNYNAERKKATCKAIVTRLKDLQRNIEANAQHFDNVHLVYSDLEALEQLKTKLQEEYESWLAYLDNEEDTHRAHCWYEEQRHAFDVFIAGIKDWTAISKEQIERQIERSPSEQNSTMSSRSGVSERIKLAELKAQSIMLEKKQALRNQMERLEIEEQMAIAKAKEQVLMEEYERPSVSLAKTDPCLPSHRKLDTPNAGAPQRWFSTEHKREKLKRPSFPERFPMLPTYDAEREDLPATPKRLQLTPPEVNEVKVSPIPSFFASRIDTYSPRRSAGRDKHPKTQSDFAVHRDGNANHADTIATFLDRQNQLAEILSEQNQRNPLPPLLLSTFSNDPADYVTFMSNFESQIESKVPSNGVRLRYLEQYLQGEAKELIKGCQFKDPRHGYPEAKKLLKEKYGDPYKISNAYIKRIADWPTITVGNDQDLEHLSIFITQCVSAMESIKYLHILDHPHNLQSLVKKLPAHLQDRWRRSITSIRESKDELPGLKSFSDFLKFEAKIISDPIFSKRALANTLTKEQHQRSSKVISNPRAKGTSIKATSHATNTVVPIQKCKLCSEGTHDLDECKRFKEKSLEDRKKFLAEHQLCYACYEQGHRSRGCMQKRKCAVCQGYHPTGLHDYNFVPRTKSKTEAHEVNNTRLDHSLSQLPIVPVKLIYADRHIETYAMLDSCSTGTFVTNNACELLQIRGVHTKILIGTVNGRVLQESQVVSGLKVSDLNGEHLINLPKAFTRDEIPASKHNIVSKESIKKWQHLRRIANSIPAYLRHTEVGILIGTNCPKALVPRDIIPCPDNAGPYATLTFAGWTVVGPRYNPQDSNKDCNSIVVNKQAHVHFITDVKEIITPTMLNSMMELEFTERSSTTELAYSQEDRRFLKILEDGISKEGNHYVLPLPFRKSEVSMPNNKELCVSRAMWLRRKLLNNIKMHTDYVKSVNDLLVNGYASKIELPDEARTTWYLPHHGVYHPQKPDKVRVVFDCSSRLGEVSLNGELLQGPDLTSSLIGVLTRFRRKPIAFQADIEAMFHQVRVTENHRDFLRFLWWPNGDLSQELEQYHMNVHLFGATSSPSCANFAVRKTADETEARGDKDTAEVLRTNFYVDDCLYSEEIEYKAIQRLQSTIEACKNGGFRLTKITSNSRAVLESVPKDERSKNAQTVDLSFDSLPIERALGVQWQVENDSFGFKITLRDKPLTRRGILSTINSVYDPLGFAAPVLLPGKIILQELCRTNVDWDDPIPEEYVQTWLTWRNQLPLLEEFSVPRCVKPANFGTVIDQQIHNFSDASSTGYGQVSYLRQVNLSGEIHCAFLMGKARLAPIKSVTVPRMELTAAVVSCKIGTKLIEELKCGDLKSTYWTDSTTVLRYIHNEQARHQPYVANRVQVIRDKTDPEQWRHVAGKDNSADDASRGLNVDKLNDQHRWIKGPDFLWRPETEWSEWTPFNDNDKNESTVNTIKVQVVPKTRILVQFHHFSTWKRLKRVVAWILRFVQNSAYRASVSMRTRQDARPKPNPLTVEELNKAERVILKIVQRAYFAAEIATIKSINQNQFKDARTKLKRKKSALKRSSPLYKLDPAIDEDGLIRVGGRLNNSDQFSEDFKHPVILPKKEHITTLIIRCAHEKMGHAGRGITLNEIRSEYWIINANSAVRSYIAKCVNCRRYRGTGSQQKMADLHKCRITPEPPFTYRAVDLFGPFIVKERRKELKRYGVIFTCLSSRAVHIETTTSLETDTFINALRRFVARRGPIREIYSDQGTNLMGAERELKQEIQNLDNIKLQTHLSTKCNADWVIKWKRNPPAASHMGGAWERQIRTVRSILKALLHENGHTLDDESLRTLLTEVESIINSRPLTFPSSDPQDLEPLTPNNLLTMKSKVILPPAGNFQKENLYLRKRWKRVQYLANVFWSRWKKEYIQSLQQRVKWNTVKRNFKVGDIVLIIQESTPRMSWPLGRITRVNADPNNIVRSAQVKTATTTLERPITKLILLLEDDTQDDTQ